MSQQPGPLDEDEEDDDWFAKDISDTEDHDRQDVIFGWEGEQSHGHDILKDVDGDGELEMVYSRDIDGTVDYDSGE